MTHSRLVALVRKRMKELQMTPYRLHVDLKGKVSKQTVYNFLTHGAVIHSDTLLAIMDLVELSIVEPNEGTATTAKQ